MYLWRIPVCLLGDKQKRKDSFLKEKNLLGIGKEIMNMGQPMIGVLPIGGKISQRFREHLYVSSLRRAGAQAVLLPPVATPGEMEWISRAYDGFLFTGGPDINPELYGETKMACCKRLNPERDTLEVPLFRLALQEKKPILAICRGCQLMNVVFGGTLYQDISTQRPGSLEHSQAEKAFSRAHSVSVEPGTRLYRAVRTQGLGVNSLHHQAIHKVGGGLVVSARSEDGLVEGIESVDYPFVMGVQWHPEQMAALRPQQQRIFDLFVQAAGKELK